jgi:hypothetical protein
MPVKRVHILANSVKNGQHCIAGRELIDRGGRRLFGEWIRPVSRHGEGELSASDCRLPNGQTPKIFDVVDISVEEYAGSGSQPENWFIDPHQRWRPVKIEGKLPEVIVDSPPLLWPHSSIRRDRISPEALANLNCRHSLYLIEVNDFRIQVGWRDYEGKLSTRRRALFRYNGRDYDFSLTDPVMTDKHCSPFPKPEDGIKTIMLDSGGDCLLCVSLTPPFNDYHYKIVATVIEPKT